MRNKWFMKLDSKIYIISVAEYRDLNKFSG